MYHNIVCGGNTTSPAEIWQLQADFTALQSLTKTQQLVIASLFQTLQGVQDGILRLCALNNTTPEIVDDDHDSSAMTANFMSHKHHVSDSSSLSPSSSSSVDMADEDGFQPQRKRKNKQKRRKR